MEVISQSMCSVSPLQRWRQALPPNGQCVGDSAQPGAIPGMLPTFPLRQARDGRGRWGRLGEGARREQAEVSPGPGQTPRTAQST